MHRKELDSSDAVSPDKAPLILQVDTQCISDEPLPLAARDCRASRVCPRSVNHKCGKPGVEHLSERPGSIRQGKDPWRKKFWRRSDLAIAQADASLGSKAKCSGLCLWEIYPTTRCHLLVRKCRTQPDRNCGKRRVGPSTPLGIAAEKEFRRKLSRS